MKVFVLMILSCLFSQIEHPVKWSYAAKRNGNEAVLFIKADIQDGWHIYSTAQEDGGPVKTSIDLSSSKDYTVEGELLEPVPVAKFEEAFNMKVKYFEHSVIFQQKVKLKEATTVKGKLRFMVCNNQKCLPPETINFSIPVN